MVWNSIGTPWAQPRNIFYWCKLDPSFIKQEWTLCWGHNEWMVLSICTCKARQNCTPMANPIWTKVYRGPAPFHRLTPNKRFEPVFSTVIMAVCSLFNRMLLLTDLIPVHLLHCGQTVMIGCNHTSFEWTRAVRHIYGIICHKQGLYNTSHAGPLYRCDHTSWLCKDMPFSKI